VARSFKGGIPDAVTIALDAIQKGIMDTNPNLLYVDADSTFQYLATHGNKHPEQLVSLLQNTLQGKLPLSH
jgi:hypothetical protein